MLSSCSTASSSRSGGEGMLRIASQVGDNVLQVGVNGACFPRQHPQPFSNVWTGGLANSPEGFVDLLELPKEWWAVQLESWASPNS